MIMASRRFRHAAWLGLCLQLSPAAQAAGERQDTTSWSASLGARHSDNLYRTSEPTVSGIVPQAGLDGVYDGHRNRLDTRLSANLLYTSYSQLLPLARGSPRGLSGGASLLASLTLLADHLTWEVSDTFGDTLINPVGADSPANRQSLNIFSTGPMLRLPFGSRNELDLRGGWYSSRFGESGAANAQGYQQYGSLTRQVSRAGQLGLYGSAMQLRYPDQPDERGQDRLRSAGVLWNARGNRTRIETQYGYSELETRGTKQRNPTARIQVARESARGTLQVTAAREFSSAGGAFQTNQQFFGTAGSSSFTGLQAVADQFRSDYGLLSYSRQSSGRALQLDVSARNERFENRRDLDSKLFGANLSMAATITEQTRLTLYAGVDHRRYSQMNVQGTEERYAAELTIQLRPSFSLVVREERNIGDLPLIGEYAENAQLLLLRYHPAPRTQSRR